jgi:modulator of FtsH protease HflK
MKWMLVAISLAALVYAATGIYTVGTDQRAIVRRFGRVIKEQSEPGLHIGLPIGLDRVVRVKPSETKTVNVGALGSADQTLGTPPTDALAQFLTGDQNLVNVQATVQFTTDDPTLYLFAAENPDRIVVRAAEASITATLADESIDSVLTIGKDALAIMIKNKLQDRLRQYQLGIDVRSVSLTELAPPPKLSDAFAKAASARSDRERLILEARTYANEKSAQARSEAQEAIDKARAAHDRAIDLARSDADRFRSLLYEYQKAPGITAARLYLETIAEIVPKFRSKLIIDSGKGVDVTIMRSEP